MDIFSSLAGAVVVQITSADLAAFFRSAVDQGIMLRHAVYQSDLTAQFTVTRGSLAKLKKICEGRGDRLEIKTVQGLYWTVRAFLRRPVLLLGLLLLLITACWLPTRVLFVQVEGNHSVPVNRILEAAESAGICFGASRREVRSEKMKNALLEAVPELQWAGVNTYGCVAKISVRERNVTESKDTESYPGSIVADRDGIIISCTATKGNLLCAVGQAVSEGEVLISGYTDCGIFIQADQAEGEVYAQTRRELTVLFPANYDKMTQHPIEKKKISLIIGKKRINLWKDSGISDVVCGRMYEEYYVTLPGGFCLPFAIAVETYGYRTSEAEIYPQEDAAEIMSEFSSEYLCDQMVAGSIHSSNTHMQLEGSVYSLTGEYVCTEMIGRMQREQIGEYHGESD